MKRQLFLIGYDIRCNKRRAGALKCIKGHAIGGQRSLYECWLTTGELNTMRYRLARAIDESDDSIVIIRLDSTASIHLLGIAVKPSTGDYFYQG